MFHLSWQCIISSIENRPWGYYDFYYLLVVVMAKLARKKPVEKWLSVYIRSTRRTHLSPHA